MSVNSGFVFLPNLLLAFYASSAFSSLAILEIIRGGVQLVVQGVVSWYDKLEIQMYATASMCVRVCVCVCVCALVLNL